MSQRNLSKSGASKNACICMCGIDQNYIAGHMRNRSACAERQEMCVHMHAIIIRECYFFDTCVTVCMCVCICVYVCMCVCVCVCMYVQRANPMGHYI